MYINWNHCKNNVQVWFGDMPLSQHARVVSEMLMCAMYFVAMFLLTTRVWIISSASRDEIFIQNCFQFIQVKTFVFMSQGW